ncbi:MAG: peptide chain release factor 2 [Planctomycetes bacterium]|nr:peptide chain release factor 2 [Planctomycetota bacterium]
METSEIRSGLEDLRRGVALLQDSFDLDKRRKDYADLERRMAEAGFWSRPEPERKSVIEDLKRLKSLVVPLEAIAKDVEEQGILFELGLEENDAATLDEVAREVTKLRARFASYELKAMLSGEDDACDAFLSINAGAGGTDSCDWAQMLLRMYTRYLTDAGYEVKIVDHLPHEEAGLKSVVVEVRGEYAYGLLKGEAGVHRLVRISPFDAANRRQTSFAAVDPTPAVAEDPAIVLNEGELHYDYYRSSGAGGQHVNVTDSAVRITHLPTGTVVTCQNERSQHKNKAMARKLLLAKLKALEVERHEKNQEALRDQKGEIAWANQIRNYVLDPYQLVKDRRTGVETGNVQKVLDGGLDPFIQAYLRHTATMTLKLDGPQS